MHRFMCVLFSFLFGFYLIQINAQDEEDKYLSIESAVSKALKNNPELKTLLKNVEATKAIKIQNSLLPNPELEIEAENILGNKDFNGFRGSEITSKISQNIFLAGKISKLEKVAEADISLAEWDYEIKRLEIITNVRRAFQQALASQILIDKNLELIKISEEFIENLHARVEAGKISPAEVSRARIILNTLQIELNNLELEFDISILELESLIYQPNFKINSLKGTIEHKENIPQLQSLIIELDNNPALKKYRSDFKKNKAIIELEEAKAMPDLTISAGYKRMNDANANTFLIGASIPLPVFDRNQGAIQESKIRLDQKESEYESIKNKLKLKLSLLHKRLIVLTKNVRELKLKTIPEAQKAFSIIKEGNLVGRFTILDVLDAEKSLFKLQNQYLNLLSEIYSIETEIEGLIAKEIN